MKPWFSTTSILFLFTALTNCTTIEPRILQDWRQPSALESKDSWRSKDFHKYLLAKGDFNGDGILDTAMLVFRKDDSSFALVALVSQRSKEFKSHILYETKDNRLIHSMGIEQVPPGTYTTACGKGYLACGKDEVPEIKIQHDAINFFMTESANSFFYWNDQSSTFQRIWISD